MSATCWQEFDVRTSAESTLLCYSLVFANLMIYSIHIFKFIQVLFYMSTLGSHNSIG